MGEDRPYWEKIPKVIETQEQCDSAAWRIDDLWDWEKSSPEEAEAFDLVDRIEKYEKGVMV